MRTATHHLPGLTLTDHEFAVPLDHAAPNGERIKVFARELVAVDKERADLPWLLFLQGGPGFAAPRPRRQNRVDKASIGRISRATARPAWHW